MHIISRFLKVRVSNIYKNIELIRYGLFILFCCIAIMTTIGFLGSLVVNFKFDNINPYMLVKSYALGSTLISFVMIGMYFLSVASTDGKVEDGFGVMCFGLLILLIFSGNLGWFLIGDPINSKTYVDFAGLTYLSYLVFVCIILVLIFIHFVCRKWFHMCCDDIIDTTDVENPYPVIKDIDTVDNEKLNQVDKDINN